MLNQVLEGLRLLSEVFGRTGPREQAYLEKESQSVRLPVLFRVQQDEKGELRERRDSVVRVERPASGTSSVRLVDRIRRAGCMTTAKRLKPLRQIHSDLTRAHGLHMHHFYYFDTATDLYLRNDFETPTRRVLYAYDNNEILIIRSVASLSIFVVRDRVSSHSWRTSLHRGELGCRFSTIINE